MRDFDWGVFLDGLFRVLTLASLAVASVAAAVLSLTGLDPRPAGEAGLAACLASLWGLLLTNIVDDPYDRMLRTLRREWARSDSLGPMPEYVLRAIPPADSISALVESFRRAEPEHKAGMTVFEEAPGIVVECRRIAPDEAAEMEGLKVGFHIDPDDRRDGDTLDLSLPPGLDRRAALRAVAGQMTMDVIHDLIAEWATPGRDLGDAAPDLVEAYRLDAGRLIGRRYGDLFDGDARRRDDFDAIRAVRLRSDPAAPVRRGGTAFVLDMGVPAALIIAFMALPDRNDPRLSAAVIALAAFMAISLMWRDRMFDGLARRWRRWRRGRGRRS
ncbi:hypothetical protein [Bifidobacterium myosotis]|uniref:Uncharacterized protein n=1 Tax=Bifidobacterium myosotis TaxID=1630166 RepID=A0A5M9ZJ57_9BIFI|nr:hypothetical protein [Bifidobacterium myosotis]KAA8826952.1 hypothetical protein EMO91_10500 [Bifidobacterium myosotis]